MTEESINPKKSKNLETLLQDEDITNTKNIKESKSGHATNTYKTVLTQALKSADIDSIKLILTEKDEAVIKQTLSS